MVLRHLAGEMAVPRSQCRCKRLITGTGRTPFGGAGRRLAQPPSKTVDLSKPTASADCTFGLAAERSPCLLEHESLLPTHCVSQKYCSVFRQPGCLATGGHFGQMSHAVHADGCPAVAHCNDYSAPLLICKRLSVPPGAGLRPQYSSTFSLLGVASKCEPQLQHRGSHS